MSGGNNANAAAAVSYANVQNDVKANITGSTIFANKVSTESHTDTTMIDAAIGSAFSGEAKGMSAAGSVALSKIQNATEATIEDSHITVGSIQAEDNTVTQGSVAITASNESFLISAAGEATAGSSYAAAGMGWAQNTLGNTTIAKALGSTFETADEAGFDFAVTADNKSKVYAVGAGLGVGLGTGANIDGAFAGNTGTNSTEALVDKSSKNEKTTISNAKSVTVSANSASKQKAVAGNIGAGNKTVSVGGAVAINKIGSEAAHQSVSAALNASDVTTVQDSTVSVSAKDEDSLLTIAAGGGVKAGGGVGVSGQGSVAISRLYKDSKAEMDGTSIDKDSKDKKATVAVNAESTGSITGSGSAMSTSAGGKVNVSGAAGVSLVTLAGDTSVTVKGGTQEVKDASVKAKSARDVLNVGVGLGVAGGTAVSVNTEANVAVNKLANNVSANVVDAAVHADNNVVVTAENTSSLKNYGGGLNLSASSGVAAVGAGATVAVNTISGDTLATVSGSDIKAAGKGEVVNVTEYTESTAAEEKGKFTYAEKAKKGFVVTADSKQTLKNVSVTAGIGASSKVGVSVDATVATNQISGTTEAKVVDTDINKDQTDVGDVAVLAHDETTVSSTVGTLGVGGGALAGVDAGAAVDTNTFSRDTSALVEGSSEKKKVNAKDLSVRASQAADIYTIEQDGGVGGGYVGVGASGAVSVNRFTGTTTAAMNNVDAKADAADVSANTAKKTSILTGSYNVKAGAAAVSATAGVITVRDESKTMAALNDSTLETAKAASVYAGNTEHLSTKAISASLAIGLGAGVSAAVSVNNLENTVSASVSNSNITAGTDASVKAKNDAKLESTNGSGSGSLVAAGVGVAINNIRTGTAASVSGGSLAAKNIEVKADESRTIDAQGVSANAGLAGIGTNVNINNIGTALADTYEYDGGSYSTSEIREKALDGLATADKATEKLASSGYAKEAGAAASSYKSAQENDAGWNSAKTDARTPGVSTSISGATLKAEKNANISSTETTNGTVNLAQGAVGVAGINVAVGITDVKTNNKVTITDSKVTGQKLTISAEDLGKITQQVNQASAAGGAVNVTVSRLIRSGENGVDISGSTLKAETHRKADAVADENDATALNISARESLEMSNKVQGTTASLVGAGVLMATVEDKINNTVSIDNGSQLSAVEYTKVTTQATETKLDASGKLVTTTKDVEVEKPDYKEINIAATNTSTSSAEAYVNAVAALSGDAAKATAILGSSDHKTGINQISIGENNTLEGGTVNVLSTNAAEVSAKVGSVGASLVKGGGAVSRAEAYGTSEISIGDGTKVIANEANVAALGKMKADADTTGFNVGLVDVVVNRAYANLYGQIGVHAGDISFTSNQWVDTQTQSLNENGETQIVAGHTTAGEGGALTIGAYDDSDNTANVDGKTVGGVAASGTNEAYTESDSHVTVELSSKSMDAKSVTLAAGSGVTSIAKANGDGGGIVGFSPVAAKAVNTVKSDTKVIVSGDYHVSGDFAAATNNHAVTKLLTDAMQVTVAGVGGTIAENTAEQNAETTVSDATISAGGKVSIGSENDYTFSPIDGQNYIIKGNGYGALTVGTASLTNTVNSSATTNLGDVTSEGEQKYWADTDNDIKSDAFVYALGVVSGSAAMNNTLNVRTNNLITTKAGTTLKTLGKDSDITLGAADDENITNRAKAENSAGLAGGVYGNTTNNITRNNNVKVAGHIYGRRNVNLYAGKFETDELASLDLKTDAEVFNRSIIPVYTDPTLTNHFTQNNSVDISGDVEAVQDVNLYADAGKETISTFVGTYTAYGGKGDPQYVAKTNGKANVDPDGNPTGGNDKTDNHITVTGSVTAGVSNYQKVTIGGDTYQGLVVLTKDQYQYMSAYYQQKGQSIPSNYVVLMSDADYESLSASEKTNAAYRKMSDFVKIYDQDGKETDKAGISSSDFTIGTYNYVSGIETRLNELAKLISEYPEGSSARSGYEAEFTSLMTMLVDFGLATYDKQSDAYTVSGDLYVNYIDLPDMVASGGNINAQTNNISGSGTITAKGTPTIEVENNTSLATNVNDVIVTEPGGKVYYNSVAMEKAEDIAKANEDTSRTIGALSVADGDAGSITIHGNAQKSTALATDKVHYLINGDEKAFPILSDIHIAGEVYAKDGTIEIRSQSDDIVVAGKSEKTGEDTAIHGKTVKLIASLGSVTQSYVDGIVNIGGDVKEQYKDQYTAGYDTSKQGETKHTVSGAQVVSTSGGRIAGSNVFISAADVNLNGTVQSGYDNFYVTISADTKLDDQNHISATGNKTVADRLAAIELENDGRNVTDHSVLGNPNYCVITGGETYNEEKGYYEYVVPVYYNPTTKTLLTPDVESNGGNIFINGRLSSTGSGKIVCLDGVSDIHITNNLSNDLRTGNLVTDDVDGVVRLSDTLSKTITEITRSDNGTLNYKTYTMVETGDKKAGDLTWDSAENGWSNDYKYLTKNDDGTIAYYNPTTGLRYNWTEGKQVGTTKTYEATWREAWWGLGSKNKLNETLKNFEKTETPIEGPSTTQDKTNGTYIGMNGNATTSDVLDVFDYYKVTEDSKKIDEEKNWPEGVFNFFKYSYMRWTTTKGEEFARTYSVKADQSVPIQFIGAMDGNSTTSVVSQGNIELGGSLGNMNTYQDASGVSVKGNVTVESKTGNIVQTGGSIYGSDVSLKAAGDIKDIDITAGDLVNLSAVNTASTASQNISLTVSAVSGAKGNVNLTGAGYADANGAETDTFQLVTKGKEGNITTGNGTTISSKRIDLTSTNGSITADVNAGQMPINSDTLSASVNAQAAKDITLTQATGDMRVGKVYSDGGNVTLNVTNGSVVDALPYGELKTSDESELLEKWQDMGLFGGDTNAMIQEKKAAIAAYNAKVTEEKDKIEDYTEWDEKALLYTIEDSIINPGSDTLPSTSTKAPNVKGNNITINVKNNAGLDSDTVTTINSKDFGNTGDGLANLKTVAKADVSTVTVKKNDDGSLDFTIKEKLPIGVQTNTAEGKLTIGKISDGNVGKSDGSIYIQGRTEEGDTKANKDLTIESIKAQGDVSIAGLGNIYYNGNAQDAAIVANNLYIASGANASIGTADKAITTDLSAGGSLRAIGVGVYIDNVGENNLAVKSVSSGGDIVLTAKKDIVMADEDTGSGDALGLIQVEKDGSSITLVSREGSVGTVTNTDDGMIQYDADGKPIQKGVRVRNSDSGKTLVTVKAAKDVAIDGVTNAVDGETPSGVLHVAVSSVNENGKLENIGLRTNGNLVSDSDLIADKTVRVESTTDLALNNNINAGKELYVGAKNVTQESKDISAANVKIAADENITLSKGSLKADKDVTLNAGKAIVTSETIEAGNDVSMNAGTTIDITEAVTAGHNITTQSTDTTTISANMTAANDLSLNSGKDLIVKADLAATNGNVTTESTGDTTLSGNVTAKTDVSVTGQNITHDGGQISGTKVTIDGKKAVDLKGSGIIATTGGAVLKAGDALSVAETIRVSPGDISMTAGTTLDVSAIVTGNNITTVSGDTTTVSKEMTSIKDMSLQSGKDLAVKATLKSMEGSITTESTGDTTLSAYVTAAQDVSVTGQNITHDKGQISGKKVTIDGKKEVDLKGNTIWATEAVIKAGTTLHVAEDVGKGNTVSMTAQDMMQEKGAVSGKNVTITASKSVALSGGSIEGTETTQISAGTDLTQAKEHTLKTLKLSADSTGELTLEGTKNQISEAVLDSKRSADGNAIVFHNGVGDSKVTVKNSLDTENSKVKGDLLLENSSTGKFNVYNLNAKSITVNGNGDVMVGDLKEDTAISADGKLNITGKSVINAAKNMEVTGDISVNATNGSIVNRATLLSKGGDITLSANEGAIVNLPDADVVTLDGSVSMTAKASNKNVLWEENYNDTKYEIINGSVYNFGDILAYTEGDSADKGNIRLVSETADVYNYDDFTDSSYEVDGKSYNIAVNDIEMSAANGVLYVGKDLTAGGKVTLTAKEGLSSIGTDILAGGDISITATDGSIYNRADIQSLDGSVSIKAEKGTVVNTLTGDVFAGGGNVELIAGGEAEENRPFYMATDKGEAKAVTPTVNGEAINSADIALVKSYKFYKPNDSDSYVKITDETNVDGLSKAELASIVTTVVYVDAEGEDQALSFTGDGVQTTTINVTVDGNTETLTAYQGDVEFVRAGDVLNRGNVVAMGQTELQEDGSYHTVTPGTITLRSDHGDVINYDNFYKVDGEESETIGDRKYMLATGTIGLVAPEGHFYNEFAFDLDGDLILAGKGDLVVGKDFTITSVKGNINITSSEGSVYNREGSTLAAGKDLNISAATGVENEGILVGGQNVSIQVENGDIDSASGAVHAMNGTVEAITKYGNVNLEEVSGDRVSVTAGGEDHRISLGDVDVGSYLKLHGDYIDTPIEVGHLDSYNGVIHFDIAGGVEKSMVKGDFKLENAGDSVFDTLHVTDADIRITDDGKVDSENIRVHGNAGISAKGSQTQIFGTMPKATDANYSYIDKNDWMSLHIIDGHHQQSNGILVRRDGGYYTNHRFALDDLARQYNGYKMSADASRYLGEPTLFYDRYDIFENTVTVSSGAEDEEFTIL